MVMGGKGCHQPVRGGYEPPGRPDCTGMIEDLPVISNVWSPPAWNNFGPLRSWGRSPGQVKSGWRTLFA